MSVGELAITPSISLVAVCCSSDSLLEFLKQPHVLDRDNRLVGEGFKKRDLAVRKRLDLKPPNEDRTDRYTLAQQRRCEQRAAFAVAKCRARLKCPGPPLRMS